MKLTFEASDVSLELRSGRFPPAEAPTFHASLGGRARITKDADSTFPGSSDSITVPDYVGGTRLEDIWLPAFVHFWPPEYFKGKKAYQPDPFDHEERPPNRFSGGDAVAEIFYSEAGSEASRYHGGDALVSISLKLEPTASSHSHALINALQDEGLRPSIGIAGFYFTRHDSIREKFGIPTWDGSFDRSARPTVVITRSRSRGQQDDVRDDHGRS